MPCYCLFDILEVTDRAKMDEYRKQVGAVVEQFVGRYVVAGGKCDLVEGSWRPVFPVILEFPSLQRAHEWYDSPEYRQLKSLRLSASKANAIFMEGL